MKPRGEERARADENTAVLHYSTLKHYHQDASSKLSCNYFRHQAHLSVMC